MNELYSYLQDISKEIGQLKKQDERILKRINDDYKLAFDIRSIISKKTESLITSEIKSEQK